MKYLLILFFTAISIYIFAISPRLDKEKPIFVEHKEPYFIEINGKLYYVYECDKPKLLYCCDMTEWEKGKNISIDSSDPNFPKLTVWEYPNSI